MPRKRMLWPKFFSSTQMARLSLEAERTFKGIWCFADDRGRIEDDAPFIWSQVWIARRDECSIEDVSAHISSIAANGQLCRYTVGGGHFLHVISWDEHQSINHPTPSKLPPCKSHHPAEWSTWWKDDDTATERWRAVEKAGQSSSNGGDSRSRLPESTPSQFSVVKFSSDQAIAPVVDSHSSVTDSSSARNIYVRPSMRGKRHA